MPFYEYQCEACANRVEVLQKISDEPLVYCPKCNEPALKKLISAAGFRLKGTGWYETDFKNGGKKSAAGDGDKPKSSGDDKSTSGGTSEPKSPSTGGSSGQSEAA